MTNFYQRGGLWVLAQGVLLLAVFLLAVRFRGDRYHPVMVFTGAILLSLGAAVVLAGAVALGQESHAIPKAVGKSAAGPARHLLTDSPSALHGCDAGVVGVGTGLAKLACTVNGVGADSVFRRQSSSGGTLASEKVRRVSRLRTARETLYSLDLLRGRAWRHSASLLPQKRAPLRITRVRDSSPRGATMGQQLARSEKPLRDLLVN
jgi:hypothetical protein